MRLSLQQMQATFWQHLQGGVGGDHAAAEVSARHMFHAEHHFAASDRLAVYADMYVARLCEALRADYREVRVWLGDALFDALARSYLQRHPPYHFSITEFGAAFPRFLASVGSQVGADLAALAWTRQQVFYAADAPTISLAELGNHPNPSAARLQCVPALQTIEVRHNVASTWRAVHEHGEAGTPLRVDLRQAPTTLAVWRAGDISLHTTLHVAEARALTAARAGATLGEACEAFAGLVDCEAAALRAVSAWFADGWIFMLK